MEQQGGSKSGMEYVNAVYCHPAHLTYMQCECESESESEVTQSCPTLCDPVDYSPPGSSVHGILQTRILEWVAISFSSGSSQLRDQAQVSRIAGRRFNFCATREACICRVYVYAEYIPVYAEYIYHYPRYSFHLPSVKLWHAASPWFHSVASTAHWQ